MRHLTFFGAVTALALASPAMAKDHAAYVGIDAGLVFPSDTNLSNDSARIGYEIDINHKTGYDLGFLGGYDFGWIRAEGELSWKWATHKQYDVFGLQLDESGDGETDVRAAMINVMGDFGSDQWNFFAGGGVGFATVEYKVDFGANEEK